MAGPVGQVTGDQPSLRPRGSGRPRAAPSPRAPGHAATPGRPRMSQLLRSARGARARRRRERSGAGVLENAEHRTPPDRTSTESGTRILALPSAPPEPSAGREDLREHLWPVQHQGRSKDGQDGQPECLPRRRACRHQPANANEEHTHPDEGQQRCPPRRRLLRGRVSRGRTVNYHDFWITSFFAV